MIVCKIVSDYMSVPDGHDLQECKQHIAGKPPPAGMEFLQLVDIIMTKEDWNMPVVKIYILLW